MTGTGESETAPPPVVLSTQQMIDSFLQALKNGSMRHSLDIASETVKILERLVTTSEWDTADQLMRAVRKAGRRFADEVAVTHSLVVDLVRRVLKVIRDEHSAALGKCAFAEQQQESLLALEGVERDYGVKLEGLGKSIAANLRELMEEFQRSPQDIAAQSEEHVHTGEVIMTFGYSRTVEKFLKKAAARRNCQVFIAEGDPYLTGHTLAKNLAESNVQTTLIQDAAVCAIMPRITKVIVGAHAILANGGLKTTSGIFNMASAADYYSVPFIALAPMYKLSPKYVTSSDQEDFNYMLPPEDLLPFENDDLLKNVEVINPAFDYVPPELISLIISNLGANAPAYYCSVVRQMYHPSDESFSDEDD